MSSGIIRIFYFTGWTNPILHFSVSGGPWAQQSINVQSSPSKKPSEWSEFVITSHCPHSLEFAISDDQRACWDNAGPGCTSARGKNYFVTRDINDGEVEWRLSLMQGVLTHVRGPPLLLVTDIDGTLVGDDEGLLEFNLLWQQRHLWRGSKLVYSTGRNLKDFLIIANQKKLLKPDFLICGVGTEVYTFPGSANPTHSFLPLLKSRFDLSALPPDALDECIQDRGLVGPPWCSSRLHARFDPEWLAIMAGEFDRFGVERLAMATLKDFTINGNIYHDPWRVSLSVNVRTLIPTPTEEVGGSAEVNSSIDALSRISKAFCQCNILISGDGDWRYVDLLPPSGGKLKPLQFIMNRLQFAPEEVMVCGDSGNDVDMFGLSGGKGCCMANSQKELIAFLKGHDSLSHLRGLSAMKEVYFANRPCAGGIVDGMRHFGFS